MEDLPPLTKSSEDHVHNLMSEAMQESLDDSSSEHGECVVKKSGNLKIGPLLAHNYGVSLFSRNFFVEAARKGYLSLIQR